MAKKHNNKTREWINVIFWGGLIAILFRSFLIEPFNIPSGSMIPTLAVGDHIFVKKWSYGYSRNSFPFGSWNMWDGRFWGGDPEIGDVIVFRKPNDTIDYVKRLIGNPGDTVQYISGRLHINGQQVVRENPRDYLIANLPKSLRSVGYRRVDRETGDILVVKGNKVWINNQPAEFNYTVEYKSDKLCNRYKSQCDKIRQELSALCAGNPNRCSQIKMDEKIVCDAYGKECEPVFAKEWTEVLPNGVRHSIIELSDNADYDNTALYTVPADHYFMMGDNRDMSLDSRFSGVGYVPRDNLLGRVWFVWYSHNYYSPIIAIWNWANKMRWDRFGLGIK